MSDSIVVQFEISHMVDDVGALDDYVQLGQRFIDGSGKRWSLGSGGRVERFLGICFQYHRGRFGFFIL